MKPGRTDAPSTVEDRTRAVARLLMIRGYASDEREALAAAEGVMLAAQRFLDAERKRTGEDAT